MKKSFIEPPWMASKLWLTSWLTKRSFSTSKKRDYPSYPIHPQQTSDPIILQRSHSVNGSLDLSSTNPGHTRNPSAHPSPPPGRSKVTLSCQSTWSSLGKLVSSLSWGIGPTFQLSDVLLRLHRRHCARSHSRRHLSQHPLSHVTGSKDTWATGMALPVSHNIPLCI